MDFDFVEVHRVKEFSFRPVMNANSEDEEDNTTTFSTAPQDCERTLNLKRTGAKPSTRQLRHSVWNVDGEIIDEPAIHVRYSMTLGDH